VSKNAVSELVYALDEAFQGTDWHSLLTNLRALEPEDWLWLPPGGQRSIRDIVEHVGECKIMYHNYAFGDGQLTWDEPHVDADSALATVDSAIEWLQRVHESLRESIATLESDDLGRSRQTNWGELKETRWIIGIMIQHDLYHSGEINHIRALHHEQDRWAFERE
jgi:DinB superfamily